MHVQWRGGQQPSSEQRPQRPARRHSYDVQYDVLARRHQKHNVQRPRSNSQFKTRFALPRGLFKWRAPQLPYRQWLDAAPAVKVSPPPLHVPDVLQVPDNANDGITSFDNNSADIDAESLDYDARLLLVVQSPAGAPAPSHVEAAPEILKKESEEKSGRKFSKSSTISTASSVSKSSADTPLPLVRSLARAPSPVQVKAVSAILENTGEQNSERKSTKTSLRSFKSCVRKTSADIDAEFENLFSAYVGLPRHEPPPRRQSFRDKLHAARSLNGPVCQDKDDFSFAAMLCKREIEAEAECKPSSEPSGSRRRSSHDHLLLRQMALAG